ncbi:MAG: sigma-70 family RNA polymerase sigma factor [Elusimicrobia bacterium]|nr:sigma-70 family RNA polymerase sigma factor [Elusimicrobiota bacterium]
MAPKSERSFSDLIKEHGEKAYNFAFRLSGNEHDAKDLAQGAFVKAYEHFKSYDPSRPFDSWLCRILHNIYLDGVRLYAHGHVVSLDAPAPVEEGDWDELLPAHDPDPTAGLTRREEDELLQKALNSVPVHYRTAVTLCDIEGLSYEQISEIMACPVGTVRSRIHQGRLLIRRAYEELEKGGRKLQ